MIGSISSAYPYSNLYLYRIPSKRMEQAQNTKMNHIWLSQRTEDPNAPVQPVTKVPAVTAKETSPIAMELPVQQGADPVEMAVRMRIQYIDPKSVGEEATEQKLPDSLRGALGAQEVYEEGKCQTCEERKYQDGSDDMGVSFQTPTRVAPELVPSAVRGHEMEHVTREQAKAEREDRKVVSQSVTYHTDICPECGKVYISGGTTRTVTAANPNQEQAVQPKQDLQRMPFSAIA